MTGIAVKSGKKKIECPSGVDLDRNALGGAMVFLDPKKISEQEAIEFLKDKVAVGNGGNLYIITHAESPSDDERAFANRVQQKINLEIYFLTTEAASREKAKFGTSNRGNLNSVNFGKYPEANEFKWDAERGEMVDQEGRPTSPV